MNKKRILFISEAVSLAHISRPLVLAESLDLDEYEVHFACGEKYKDFIINHPFHFWALNDFDPDDFLKAQKSGGFFPFEK